MIRALAIVVLLAPATSGCVDSGAACGLERCDEWVCGEPRPSCPCSDLCERPACVQVTVYVRDPSGGGCSVYASPCDVPEGQSYFLDEQQCASGAASCGGDSDCPGGESCDVRSCALDAIGTCVEVPEACPAEGPAVLGCDGELYPNDCLRLASGARLEPTADPSVEGCAASSTWARDPVTGACTFFASSCLVPDDWALFLTRADCEGDGCSDGPVWVAEGDAGACLRLESECDVAEGDEYFTSAEACEIVTAVAAGARCDALAGCPEGMVCDPDRCGAEAGACVPLPPECIDMMESVEVQVCGCDGLSYASDCDRLLAGVGLAHAGRCDDGVP